MTRVPDDRDHEDYSQMRADDRLDTRPLRRMPGGDAELLRRNSVADRQDQLPSRTEPAKVETPRLPEGLADHAFGRSGCMLVDGEPLLAARARGSAAECAADALLMLKAGDVERADDLLEGARQYLIRYRAQS